MNDKAREAFEAADPNIDYRRKENGEYEDVFTEGEWHQWRGGWTAALQWAASQQAAEGCKRVSAEPGKECCANWAAGTSCFSDPKQNCPRLFPSPPLPQHKESAMSSEPEALRLAEQIAEWQRKRGDVGAMEYDVLLARARIALQRQHAGIETLTDSCAAKADRIDRLGETVQRLMAEREADRAAMREALEALETCDCAHISDGGRQWYDEAAVDTAIEKLKARTA